MYFVQKKYYPFVFLFFLTLQSCVTGTPYRELAPGAWHAEIQAEDKMLPFVFVVKNSETVDKPISIEIYNGDEKIEVSEVEFHKSYKDDTIFIKFPHYDTYIKAVYEKEMMKGFWVVPSKKKEVPFEARHVNEPRFKQQFHKPLFDVNGSWEVTFYEDDSLNTESKAIGEFKVEKNKLLGTFMTETGDYRFLEGVVQGNEMKLSCFDGTHAYYFEATLMPDGTLQKGGLVTATGYHCTWEAKRNPSFKLRDANAITQLKSGSEFDFSFPNETGQNISPKTYQGKVRVVQLFGTWCPNCADETMMLNDLQKELSSSDLKIISLAFEKKKEPADAWKLINFHKKRFGVNWDFVLAGENKRAAAGEKLPSLSEIYAFPTLIVMDKKGTVRRIHTGFSGPATSEYKGFYNEMKEFLKTLIAE